MYPYPYPHGICRDAVYALMLGLFAGALHTYLVCKYVDSLQNMLERQRVGISAAQARGAYKGRVPTAQAKSERVLELTSKGLTKQEIADACSIGLASVYRILKARSSSAATA